jgi:isopentenyl diphosphate isomerase/L-lactate dehydrogenase-like FMN-dependent dehydrogenase
VSCLGARSDRLRDATSLKLLIKGILTPEDAQLAAEHGADSLAAITRAQCTRHSLALTAPVARVRPR